MFTNSEEKTQISSKKHVKFVLDTNTYCGLTEEEQ